MSRITNKQLLEALNGINTQLASLDARLTALESGETTSTTTKTSSKKKSVSNTAKVNKVVDLSNFEPKKDKDGFYNWNSYKACRTAYCYTVAGCKVWKGKVTKPEGFVFDEKAWNTSKAAFEKQYKYTKKSDR